MLTQRLIQEAAVFLKGKVRHSPIEYSPVLSEKIGVKVHFKLECLQVTGSFKIRGSFFALSRRREECRNGVATCSAGNHGKGIAYAARKLGIPATIFVPAGIEEAKYRAMIGMGSAVRKSEYTGFDDTEAWARQEAEKAGLPFISAYDDEDIMAGNGGTLAMEVLADVPEAKTFILPVGGGGLAGGFSYYMKACVPDASFIGCQHEASPALSLSLEQGEAVTTLPGIETLAGGLEGGIGETPFEVLQNHICHVALCSEKAIREGVLWMMVHHQYLIEPSSAVTIAACLSGTLPISDEPVVVVITGRNMSLNTLRTVLKRKPPL